MKVSMLFEEEDLGNMSRNVPCDVMSQREPLCVLEMPAPVKKGLEVIPNQMWCFMPIIPSFWEAEAGGIPSLSLTCAIY